MPKIETPRHRILRLRKQIKDLWLLYQITTSTPGFCDFCVNFWSERYYYEGDSGDYGCRVTKKLDDDNDVIRCQKFRPQPRWETKAEKYLSDRLFDTVEKLAPYRQSINHLKVEIGDLQKAIRELEAQKAEIVNEVFQRMTG